MKFILALIVLVLLTACASTIPMAIREPVKNAPNVQSARSAKDELAGQRVRWGGVIAGIKNNTRDTLIEVVDRPLDKNGRPLDSDTSGGRFLARIPGFLDPAIYANERELTVAGALAATITRPVGDYLYRYPVVEVDTYYLWAKPLPPPPQYPYYYDRFWYDPWYPPIRYRPYHRP